MQTKAALAALLISALACSSQSNNETNPKNIGPSGATGSFGTGGDASVATCSADAHESKLSDLDLYIMMDRSGSMGSPTDRWHPVVKAIKDFIQSPGAAGIGVGIQYFSIRTPTGDMSCNVADYARPDVEIAKLPDVAGAIIASLDAHSPDGETPTLPALEGAVQHATEFAGKHPDHKVVIVLATDGKPKGCTSDVKSVAQIAKAASSATPQILTFVIGIGDETKDLNAVAVAGGTEQALMVQDNANTGQQFLDALAKIRKSSIQCEYTIPQVAGGVDYERVNVRVTMNGSAALLKQVPSRDKCDPKDGGWFYDNPTHPTKVEICDASCAAVNTVEASKVDVLFGCATVKAPIK